MKKWNKKKFITNMAYLVGIILVGFMFGIVFLGFCGIDIVF